MGRGGEGVKINKKASLFILVVRVKSEIYFTVSPIKGLHAAGMPT
jgi:hypothetical protein